MASKVVASADAPECLCGGRRYAVARDYDRPPPGEVRFELTGPQGYFRRLLRCLDCGHYRSVHEMDMSALYSSAYVNSTYGEHGMRRAFERITALDPGKSDNIGRVERIVGFAKRHWQANRRPSVLDVGSGLCVFLHRLKSVTGWDCTALDPDPRAVRHAETTAGVNGICGDFLRTADLGRYSLITFNKVLEHVLDPVAMLAKSSRHLTTDGAVYIELPDAEKAAEDSLEREEFFVEHHHVFSRRSMSLLAQNAGFDVLTLERLREPSGKYTLFAFLRATGSKIALDR
jgi:SAM-dependent methyltransferase